VACKGANFTYMITCALGESVSGRAIPLILKSFATRLALLNETFPVPVFVMVTATVLLVPSVTLPKLMYVGLKESVPDARAGTVIVPTQHSSRAETMSTCANRLRLILTLSSSDLTDPAGEVPAGVNRNKRGRALVRGLAFLVTPAGYVRQYGKSTAPERK